MRWVVGLLKEVSFSCRKIRKIVYVGWCGVVGKVVGVVGLGVGGVGMWCWIGLVCEVGDWSVVYIKGGFRVK